MQLATMMEQAWSVGQSYECVTHRLLPLYVPQGRYPLGQGGGREGDGEESSVSCAMFRPDLPHPHPNPPLEGEGVAGVGFIHGVMNHPNPPLEGEGVACNATVLAWSAQS